MPKFAEKTKVPVAKSKAEIERTLTRYGASQFGYSWEEDRAIVAFRLVDRLVRFTLLLPRRDDPKFRATATGRERSEAQAEKEWEQACRASWRSLNLVIKAKLEAVECGITTLDQEFLAHLVLPNGQTVSEWGLSRITTACTHGDMPKLLPFGGK